MWINAVADPRAGLSARAEPRQAHSWYEIKNADGSAGDTAELLLYEDIGGWYGSTAEDFVYELKGVTAANLTVRINSPGGSVFEGVAIANALRAHPASVTVQVDGIAASIASVIALAGDRLVMMPHSQLMIHDASGLAMGNAADMTQMAALLDLQSDNIADVYAAKAGGTREEWRARMQAETWYLAAEAVEAGLANEVAPGRPGAEPAEPDDRAMTNTWDLSVFRYAGRENAPAPEPVARAAPSSLTFTAGSVLTEEMVALLHASVAPAEPEEPVVEPTPIEPEPAPTAEPTEPAVAPAAAADDEWAASVAHLTTPPPSADDEFTRLKEALL